jgi:hypothetical protein
LTAFISWAGLGAGISSPSIRAYAHGLLKLEVTRAVSTTDGTIRILGALLVAREALETGLAGAFGALGTLLSEILITDVAASLTGAEVTTVAVSPRAFILADIAEKSLVAFAYGLELVVHSAFATARA